MALDDFLACIRDCEADLDAGDNAAQKRLWRKVGAHMIRMHEESAETLVTVRELRKVVFDHQNGLIAQNKQQIDRLNWTIRILSAIGAITLFILALVTAIYKFWTG